MSLNIPISMAAIGSQFSAVVADNEGAGMLTDYIEPEERVVACPNQEVVYGGGFLALDASPV